MHDPKIDLLKAKHHLGTPDEKPFLFFRKTFFLSCIGLALLGAVFSFRVQSTTDRANQPTDLSLFSIVKNFVLPEDGALIGEENNRVNFLLTGIGGEGHEGPQLTDTILFASFRPSTKTIGLLSLPRDLTVLIQGHGYQKINHVNAYAENERAGSGAEVTAAYVGELLKQPVPYYLRVDFDGFAELIDTLGGIDVNIDHPFTDPSYPIPGKELDSCGNTKTQMNPEAPSVRASTSGFVDAPANASGPRIPPPDYSCRFESLTFKKGSMHMDGKTALAFVRSRHGNNGEGSDFARSRRQQKIMLAVKDKLFSVSTFLNPVRITGLFETLDQNISTNLSVAQLMRIGKEFRDLSSDSVVNHVVDDAPTSPLYSTMLNGAYVLLPKNDDWTVLQQMALYVFAPEPASATPVYAETPAAPTPVVKQARVEIQNGTTVSGLAFRASQLLEAKPTFQIIKVGNAITRNYEHTVIFDLTDGTKPNELKSLQAFLKAEIAKDSGWMKNNVVDQKQIAVETEETHPIPTASSVDFLVILGQSAQDVVMK